MRCIKASISLTLLLAIRSDAQIPPNTCNVTVNITSAVGPGYSTPICAGKLMNCTGNDGQGIRVTELRGSCGGKRVTYTIKYCNQDKFPFVFSNGQCNYTNGPLNGQTSGPCSYAYVNANFVSGDFNTALAAGSCRTITVNRTINTCEVAGTGLSASIPSQIQIQGRVNRDFCRAYAFLRVVYQAADPNPSQSRKPTSKPTVKPAAKPTAKPTASNKKPTARPTMRITAKPTPTPTAKPTSKPSAIPTAKPSTKPTAKPTANPTIKPTLKRIPKPSLRPSRRSKKRSPY